MLTLTNTTNPQVEITGITQLAGIPHPAVASAGLAALYGLPLRDSPQRHPELYDLAWVVAGTLSQCLGQCRLDSPAQKVFRVDFWSFFPGSPDPREVRIVIVLHHPASKRPSLHLSLADETKQHSKAQGVASEALS